MALTFTTTKMVAPAQETFSFAQIDLLNSAEALNQAWVDLTNEQKSIDGVQEIMDNINQSANLIKQYGKDAIPMLNADGGLEALLGIPEKLITIEKAQEGLGEAAKKTALFIVEWLAKVCGYILKIMGFIVSFHGTIRMYIGQFIVRIGQCIDGLGEEVFLKIARNAKYARSQVATEGKLDGVYSLSHPVLSVDLVNEAHKKIDELKKLFNETSQKLSINFIESCLKSDSNENFHGTIADAMEKIVKVSDDFNDYNSKISADLNDTDTTAFEKGYNSTTVIRDVATACKDIAEEAEKLATSIDAYAKAVDSKKSTLINEITINGDPSEVSKKSELVKSWAMTVMLIVKTDLSITKSIRTIFSASRGGLKDLAMLASRNA